jgi:hypothetical protein
MDGSQSTEPLTQRADFTGIVGRIQKMATPVSSPEAGVRLVLDLCRRGEWEKAAWYFQGGIASYRVVPTLTTDILGRVTGSGTADAFEIESDEYHPNGATLRIATRAGDSPLGTWTWHFDRGAIGWTIREVI